jgi:hypothetical protein
MKILAFLNIMILLSVTDANLKINEVRKLYYQAAVNEDAAVRLKKMLTEVNDNSDAIFVCYKGASQMLDAKYAFNPITKLNRFKKGKTMMEKAINKDPNHLEMRFIRFSIQTNLPSFLGYNNWIESDKKLLLLQTSKTKDEDLKLKISNYLVKYCTKEELKKLNN